MLCARSLENTSFLKKNPKKLKQIRAAEGKGFKLASEINEGWRKRGENRGGIAGHGRKCVCLGYVQLVLILGARCWSSGAGIPSGFVPQTWKGNEGKDRLRKERCDEEWGEILGMGFGGGSRFPRPAAPRQTAPFLTVKLVSQRGNLGFSPFLAPG